MPLEDPVLFPKGPAGGEEIPEGANAPFGNFLELALAGEGIPLWRSERSRWPTQKYVESQQQLREVIVSYFTAHKSINLKM
jgi:hypothetical protein